MITYLIGAFFILLGLWGVIDCAYERGRNNAYKLMAEDTAEQAYEYLHKDD